MRYRTPIPPGLWLVLGCMASAWGLFLYLTARFRPRELYHRGDGSGYALWGLIAAVLGLATLHMLLAVAQELLYVFLRVDRRSCTAPLHGFVALGLLVVQVVLWFLLWEYVRSLG